MNLKTYQKLASRTLTKLESPLLDELHMVTGIVTESAELADAYKKHFAYKKPLDEVNCKEELGDLMWYISNLCMLKDWDIDDILDKNIKKLSARYPDKYSDHNASNRDLNVERQILEQ